MKFYKQPCTFDIVFCTKDVQIDSVMTFAGAMGYEPVYNKEGVLLRFRGDRYRSIGAQYVSPSTMIQMHNQLGEAAYAEIMDPTLNTYKTLDDLLANDGDIHIIVLMAHYTRRVKKAKLVFTKGKGFEVQSHKVEFMTKVDRQKAGM